MEDYALEERPFAGNSFTGVMLYRGISKSRNNLPIVAKRHKFTTLEGPEMSKRLNAAMNAGLAQARVDHQHSCKIIAMHLDVRKAPSTYYLYHILEGMEGDMRMEINQRKEENRPYNEVELWDFLVQVTSALAFAHKKVTNT